MRKSLRKPRAFLIAAGVLAGLQGCLYTSHHFNTGRILEPGNTAVTLGYGRFNLGSPDCDEVNGYMEETDSLDVVHCVRRDWSNEGLAQDTAKPGRRVIKLPRLSLGYRLGVRGEWGPFTGVELGWHLEAPTNPGSVEFDLKFGLPDRGSPRFDHSLSGGWIVGMWADNSYFGEYAASRSFGPGSDAYLLYFSYRYTYLATQPDEVFATDSPEDAFIHRRRSANQASVGLQVRMPDWVLFPDFLSPQATFSTPWVPVLDDVAPEVPYLMNLNIGFGWRF